eukprot:CAMPEP_0177692822 /NCGR_PEP_ID=MMETSP0484_2-20121128/2064_1 /TAXON_ID=354590 /ORGANISM="Rhodomonas lens, Strain RHODO" /LENGTH=442 /DNA_ID=CAMNT_0019203577 /DNA_START=244 /DNA_END=1568 /DNA_ORIENTATION=-
MSLEAKKLETHAEWMENKETAVVLYETGKLDEAQQIADVCLQQAKDAADKELELLVLPVIGNIQEARGRFGSAVELHLRVRELALELEDVQGLAMACNNLGSLYGRMGHNAKAGELLSQFLSIALELGISQWIIGAYMNLATLSRKLKQNERAFQMYEKCLEMASKAGDPKLTVMVQHNMGVVLSLMGRYEEALANFSKRLELTPNDIQGIGRMYNDMGFAYSEMKNYPAAIEVYEKKRAISAQLGDHSGMETALHNLGRTHFSDGSLEQAKEDFVAAITFSGRVQESVRSDLERVSLFEDEQKSYKWLQRTLLALHRTADAFAVSEHGKGRSLVRSVEESHGGRAAEASDVGESADDYLKQRLAEVTARVHEEGVAVLEYSLLPGLADDPGDSLVIWLCCAEVSAANMAEVKALLTRVRASMQVLGRDAQAVASEPARDDA